MGVWSMASNEAIGLVLTYNFIQNIQVDVDKVKFKSRVTLMSEMSLIALDISQRDFIRHFSAKKN